MKTKRVLRYYCDFCKKSGGSKHHMAKHEKHCTMNPDRECRVCNAIQNPQPDLAVLVALLPNPDEYYDAGLLWKAAENAMPALREAAGHCPVCILAALRQARVPAHMMTEHFNYKKEMESLWATVNAEAEEDYR